jgi:hypothetical protein
MFARKAKIRDLGHVLRAVPSAFGHSNDNQANRSLVGKPAPSGKRDLVCHWHINPASGKPECIWTSNGNRSAASRRSGR